MRDRFSFGRNWRRYAAVISEDRIEQSIRGLLGLVGSLDGKSFLDVGCGSGVHSLAALRSGASRVDAFDYDPTAVQVTQALLERYAPDADWSVRQGDILRPPQGKWDVVYAWGVLHHTGDLWAACAEAGGLVAHGGLLVVALYNDQGLVSRLWRAIKWSWVKVPPVRPLLLLIAFLWTWGGTVLYDVRTLRNPLERWRDYGGDRGMAAWNDLLDWTGGYPFEVATADQVVGFYAQRGFRLQHQRLVGNARGCNEFVFVR